MTSGGGLKSLPGMMRRLAALPGITFALVLAWKVALLLFTAQPVPSNDAFFYDGPVVNYLLHGKYCNPSLALVLPISGNDFFCAYPPLYQAALLGWMSVLGTSALAAMWLHVLLFGVYAVTALAILRRLQAPAVGINIAGLLLFSITFHDRPDSLAHVLGMAAVYVWVRGAYPRCAAVCSLSCAEGGEGRGEKAHFLPEQIPSSRLSPRSGVERESGPVSGCAWLTAALLVLTFCTSLQIGGTYFLWLALLAVGGAGWRQIQFPWAAAVGLAGTLAVLISLVKFGFPHFWAGFQEHAQMTSTLTGWRLPQVADLIKVVRTIPGILIVGAALVWRAARGNFSREWLAKSPPARLAVTGTVVGFAMIKGSLLLLSANSIMIANYLQPVVVGCLLAAWSAEPCSRKTRNILFASFALAALLVSVRAIGMTTWGLACARDVSYAQALARVRAELDAVPDGCKVLVTSAYLYETAQRTNVTWIHADWPSVWSPDQGEMKALLKVRPAKLILTQFDYHRRQRVILDQLSERRELAALRVTDTARVPVPDASPALQKVVQHISWAPVIVELSWHE